MKRFFAILALIVGIGVVSPAPVYAIDLFKDCQGEGCSVVKEDKLNHENKAGNTLWNIISQVLFVLAGVAVIMIIVGGIRFASSMGNPEKVKAAKTTILYAVIGLVIAVLGGAIVRFIIDNIG